MADAQRLMGMFSPTSVIQTPSSIKSNDLSPTGMIERRLDPEKDKKERASRDAKTREMKPKGYV
jgi:hypothetical protein